MTKVSIAQNADLDRQNGDIAARLRCVRDRLNFTQSQFAYQLGISRERLVSHENGRTPLRCDIAIRICRYYFVNEFWLASGAVDDVEEKAGHKVEFGFDVGARLTMALAAEQVALTLPPGVGFLEGFASHLRAEYLRLAKIQEGWPRIVPLPYDSSGYSINAVLCMMDFWESRIGSVGWPLFLHELIDTGNKLADGFTLPTIVSGNLEFVDLVALDKKLLGTASAREKHHNKA